MLHPEEVSQLVAALVERELGFLAVETRRMHGGNNLLLVLTDAGGERMLAKVYQPDDARHRDRLGREYRALAFLREAGFADVPEPRLCSRELRCGVYSFEEGCHRAAADLTEADAERLVDVLLRFERLGPPVPRPELPPDEGGNAPPVERVVGLQTTVEQFRARASATGALPALQGAVDSPSLAMAEAALDALARECAADPVAIAPLSREALRFSQGDFGRHNALFRGEAPPCLVDFEYAHWGDPGWVVASFVHHDANAGMRPAVCNRFLDAYRARGGLGVERLPLLLRMAELSWVVEHLAGTRPDRLRIGAETTPGFDANLYVADHLRQFEARLEAYVASYGSGS